MATVFRPPLVTRQPPLDRGVAIRSQADVTGINILLHTNPVPFHQTDWPVPAGPRRAVTLHDVAGINILIHTNPVPFHQTEWPVPAGPRQPSMRFDAAGINILLHTNPFPFSQTDWPVPKGPNPGIVTSRTWTQSPAQPTPAAPSPFFQTDWPVPRGRTSHDLRSFVQSLSLPQLATVKPVGSQFSSSELSRSQARSMAALLFNPPNLLTTTLVPPATSGLYDFWHYYSP